MKIKVKCPECSKELSISINHVTWTVKCRQCSRQFIPVEDAGLPCPQCGNMTIMLREDAFKELTCLDCGYVFRRKSIWRRSYYALPIAIGAGALILLISLLLVSYALRRQYEANEASAIAVLRTISSAQELFNVRYGRYAPTLAALANVSMLDPVTANATFRQRPKAGYYFILNITPTGWECVAMPAQPGRTGTRSFYIHQDGVIYHAPCMSEDDPPASPSYIGEPFNG